MTDSTAWDLIFAIKISELNARLTQPDALPKPDMLCATSSAGDVDLSAFAAQIQVVEVMPNTPREPGPKATLAIQMDLSALTFSGSRISHYLSQSNACMAYDSATIFFEVTLQFVGMTEQPGATPKLVFNPLPPNQPGQQVLTSKFGELGLDPGLRLILDGALADWLRQHFDLLSPCLALFGTPGGKPEDSWMALPALSYSYIQAPSEGDDLLAGDDLLCVFGMLSGSSGPAPDAQAVLPEFVEGGKAAFLLGTDALMGKALLPALNGYAAQFDPGTSKRLNGQVFRYDSSTSLLTLANDPDTKAPVWLQNGTVSNEDMPSPLWVKRFDVIYGADALVLKIEQSATLQTMHSYYQGSSGQGRTEIVPWCNIYRAQVDIMDVAVLPDASGTKGLTLVARGGDAHVDTAWSEPVGESTGNPVADMVLKILQGVEDSLPLFLGPVGAGIFIFKLAVTTICQEVDIKNIQNAKDQSQPLSADAIVKALNFSWGGIGDIEYGAAKFQGGLKVIGA